jgi:hypothetical protein
MVAQRHRNTLGRRTRSIVEPPSARWSLASLIVPFGAGPGTARYPGGWRSGGPSHRLRIESGNDSNDPDDHRSEGLIVADPLPARPWWRRPRARLSVRAFSIGILILGGYLGWLVQRARVQREVVAAVKRGGGYILYDWEYDGWRWRGLHYRPPRTPRPRPPADRPIPAWRKWLIDRFGPDAVADVKLVEVGPEDPDGVMAQVGRLGRVSRLEFLDDAEVSDAGFKQVRNLTSLEELGVPDSPRLTRASLPYLARLTRLRSLSFDHDFPLTDADLITSGA